MCLYVQTLAANMVDASRTLFTAHESLLLPYEQELTRINETTGEWFARSAHMIWIGERTRQLDGAHVQFAAGISNPIGIKVSEKCEPDELLQLLAVLNPHNIPGRICVITRMGAESLHEKLPGLIQSVQQAEQHVVWMCDPMHGNTIKTPAGVKTRRLDDIQAEIKAFFDVHAQMGSIPGGVHLELTGGDVTECVGGAIGLENLSERYLTACDPRLNDAQALELASFIANLMQRRHDSLL